MQTVLTGKETTKRFAGFAQTDDKTKISHTRGYAKASVEND
jgi:hypothetical protein